MKKEERSVTKLNQKIKENDKAIREND